MWYDDVLLTNDLELWKAGIVQVSRYTWHFIVFVYVWTCCLNLLVFSNVVGLGGRSDARGIMEGQLGHPRDILDKSRELMKTCDVLWWCDLERMCWCYTSFINVLGCAQIEDLGLWEDGIWTCWYFVCFLICFEPLCRFNAHCKVKHISPIWLCLRDPYFFVQRHWADDASGSSGLPRIWTQWNQAIQNQHTVKSINLF